MVGNRNDQLGLRGQESQSLLGPQRLCERGRQFFASGSLGGQTHFAQLVLVDSEPNHRLEMKAIAAAEEAPLLRVEKGPDRGRTAPTLIAGRADGRIPTARAQPRQKFVKTSKREFAPAGRAAGRSDNGNGRCQQAVHKPAAPHE